MKAKQIAAALDLLLDGTGMGHAANSVATGPKTAVQFDIWAGRTAPGASYYSVYVGGQFVCTTPGAFLTPHWTCTGPVNLPAGTYPVTTTPYGFGGDSYWNTQAYNLTVGP